MNHCNKSRHGRFDLFIAVGCNAVTTIHASTEHNASISILVENRETALPYETSLYFYQIAQLTSQTSATSIVTVTKTWDIAALPLAYAGPCVDETSDVTACHNRFAQAVARFALACRPLHCCQRTECSVTVRRPQVYGQVLNCHNTRPSLSCQGKRTATRLMKNMNPLQTFCTY